MTGDDAEMAYLYGISRYPTVSVVDVSNLEVDISPLEELPDLKTVYAVGEFDSELFYEDNLHVLQSLYNSGVTCYLYDKQTPYQPEAQTEGAHILNLLPDISCDIVVAADGKISDNNPTLAQEINDFDIAWSVSNTDNYEIVDNKLTVKDYTGIDDEVLILTAQITVYPDQEPVVREFEIGTDILRMSAEYYEIQANGYSQNLSREKAFTYAVNVIAKETENFAEPVKPVVDYIEYTYSAVAANGEAIPYANVLTVGENNSYSIAADAPLNATATITISIGHTTKSGENVDDVDQILVPVTVASRTFTVTFVTNGGKVTDANGASIESYECVEDSLIFEHLTVARTGYIFKGWYTDSAFENLFSEDGSDAVMPTENITLYAKWEAHSFTLYFDANGGSVSEESRLILCDTEFGTLPTPTTGYTISSKGSTSITVTGSVTSSNIYATATVNSYTASWNAGTNCTITVKRTSSPNKGASTGTLSSGATVYYGDVLSITYTANTGYSISTKGSTSVTVTGNVTSSTIYATATANSYTYNIVYKSSNGTALGTSTATYKYGTTNTISAPAKSGYNTPSSQSVKWDSISAKTITFTYTPSSVATSQFLTNGTWWDSTGSTGITFSVNAEYQNRTANSVQVRIVWTQTITNAAYGYNQYFYCSMWNNGTNRGNTGNVKIASTSTWPYYSSSGPWHNGSVTAYSGWVTVSLDSTDSHGIEIACDWWTESSSQSGSWSGKMIYVPAY